MVAGAIGCLMQTGPVLSFTPIKPDFKRLNPVDGLKRIFNIKLLFDAVRAVVKAALLAFVIWYFLKHSLAQLLALIGCAANLVLQGGVKSADGKAVLAFAFSAASAAVRCTAGQQQ